MSEFNLSDYSSLTEDQLKITTSKYPVYIHNEILNEYVFWTPEHIRNNDINSLTNRYNENRNEALKIRLFKILDQVKNKLYILSLS
jgi:hypothetical protein